MPDVSSYNLATIAGDVKKRVRVKLLVIEFHLSGCRSLKEKRRRMGGIKDRFARRAMLALLETGFQDEHTHSEWSFVIVAHNRKMIDQCVAEVERDCQLIVDGVISRIHTEDL